MATLLCSKKTWCNFFIQVSIELLLLVHGCDMKITLASYLVLRPDRPVMWENCHEFWKTSILIYLILPKLLVRLVSTRKIFNSQQTNPNKNCRFWSMHQNADSPKNSKFCYGFLSMSTFKLTWLCNYCFDFAHRDSNRKFHAYCGGFGKKIGYFEPCVRNLRVRIFQKTLWLFINVRTQTQIST